MSENPPRPIYGKNAVKLNYGDALRLGMKIFRAWRCCGCCTVDMAFYEEEGIRREFGMPMFADVVRDDLGNIFEAVNTLRGYRQIQIKGKPQTGTSINSKLLVSAEFPLSYPSAEIVQTDSL